MGQPTTVQNGQRLDMIEQELASLKNSMAEEIGAVVSKSSAEMQQNITNQNSSQLGADFSEARRADSKIEGNTRSPNCKNL